MTRTKLLFRSVIGSVGGRIAVLIAPFFVMPAMLGYLGEHNFGIWMTAIAITGFIQFADLGIGSGLLTRLSAAHSRSDTVAFRSYVASSFAVLGAVALLLSAAGVILLVFLPDRISPIYSVTLIAFAFSIPGSIIYRILYATSRIVLANIWQVGAALASVAAALAAMQWGWSRAAVVFTYAVISPLIMLACTVWIMAREKQMSPRPADIKMADAIDLMRLGWKFFILAILTAASMNADNILIALRLGESAVTAYAVPARIGTLLMLIVGTIAMPLWTIYGSAISSGERLWVWRNALLVAALGLATVVVAGAILMAGIDLIMSMWMGRSFPDQHKIIFGITALSAVTSLTAPFNMILNATAQVRPQIIAWTGFVLVALCSKWVLLPQVGAWALPLIDAILYSAFISILIFFLARKVVLADPAGGSSGERLS